MKTTQKEPDVTVNLELQYAEYSMLLFAVRDALRFWRKAKTENSRQYARQCIAILRQARK
jgi:hypothetical protein